IRFYFDTGDQASNSYPGWYFDDVVVSASGPAWLTVKPTSGTVPISAAQELAAQLDATALPGGDYAAETRIASTPPDPPQVLVPAQLHVTSAPDIDVSASAVDFGQVFVGQVMTDSLTIANGGVEPLTVSSVEVVNAIFQAPTGGFTVPVAGKRTLMVTYAPPGSGTFDGSITFHNDDPNAGALTVPLHGEAVEPPIVSVSPPLLSVTVPVNEVRSEDLTLTNAGGSPLTWNVDLTF